MKSKDKSTPKHKQDIFIIKASYLFKIEDIVERFKWKKQKKILNPQL